MKFKVEQSDRYIDTYYLVDTRNYNSVMDEYDSKYEAEVQCELFNEVYEQGIEDGKEYILNGGGDYK